MSEIETDDTPDPDEFTNSSPCPTEDKQLAEVCATLHQHGVTRVVVEYDGSGDSGCISDIEFTPESTTLPGWFVDRLRDLAEHYCPEGYENNEGGYGSLTVYPAQGLAALEHFDRIEDSEDMGVHEVALSEQLSERLTKLGLTTIAAHFDGYGDSGQLEGLAIQPETVTVEQALLDELESFLLDQLPGGWENNEGGYGDFTIDVANRQLVVDAHWRVVTSSDPTVTRWRWRK